MATVNGRAVVGGTAYPVSANISLPGDSLPSGVTLRAIDGGPSYYADNGFTNAVAAGFDSPDFFPVGVDYPFYNVNSPATFRDLGLNFAMRITSDTDLAFVRNAGIPCVLEGLGTDYGSETIGWHIEEPSSWSDILNQAGEIAAGKTGRFLHISNTINQLVYGGYQGTPGNGSMQAVMSSAFTLNGQSVHLDIPSDDVYWFAGSATSFWRSLGGALYGLTGSMTTDQAARGDHYGDMVDWMRSWVTQYPAPVLAPYIETEDGLLGDSGKREILPAELNWAVWSTLVHGARGVLYFGTTSNYGTRATFGFSKNVLAGQSVAMYDQAKAVNTKVQNCARILNSPFALGYATVTPSGYVFPALHASLTSGVDIMAKYYDGESYSNGAGNFARGFYIFATIRGSESQSNVNATFTTADHYTGPVAVVGENRTVQASNGVFTDVFATATTEHVYQVPA